MAGAGPSNTATVNPLFTCFGSANEGLPLNPRHAFYYQTTPDSFGFTANPLGFGYRDLGLGTFLRSIIRWMTNNPGGSDVHYGVVHYGTDPNELSQMAKNPITLNQNHPESTFRVQMRGLEPRTTYYYVTSMGSNGTSDEVQSKVSQFTTP